MPRDHRASARFVGAALGALLLAFCSAAPAAERLYVSTFAGYNDARVRAFDIIGGLALPRPAFEFSSASGPLTVGPDGALFAGNDKGSAQNLSYGLAAYVAGNPLPVRSFFPHIGANCPGFVVLPLLATERLLFFGYSCYAPGLGPHGRLDGRAFPTEGIMVYELTSATTQRLVNIIDTGFLPTGLALDEAGRLYAGDFYGGEVDVYKDPATAPRLVRRVEGTSFHGPGLAPGALALDASGELYVFNFGVGTVSAYPSTASGPVEPDRTISPSEYNTSPWGYIALCGNTLFMSYQAGAHIGAAAFDKRRNGTQKPLQVLEIPDIYEGLTVGGC